MTNTNSTAPVARNIKTAPLRTRQYVRALTSRRNGISAADLRDAVGAFTKHNSWSLTRLAAIYGYALVTNDDQDLLRYRFVRAA